MYEHLNNNANSLENDNKEGITGEFWDCMFSMLMTLSLDQFSHITEEEWLEGFERTVAKVSRRAVTNHYGDGKNEE